MLFDELGVHCICCVTSCMYCRHFSACETTGHTWCMTKRPCCLFMPCCCAKSANATQTTSLLPDVLGLVGQSVHSACVPAFVCVYTCYVCALAYWCPYQEEEEAISSNHFLLDVCRAVHARLSPWLHHHNKTSFCM